MKITQVSVFIENTKGRLANLCELLGKNNIDIKALTLAESPDFGIARFIVEGPDKTLDIVRKNGYTASIAHIVAVEVSDTPGGLAAVLKVLSDNDMDIKYMYGFVEKSSEKALMVFKFADIDKAIGILQNNKIPIVSKETIFKGN